MTSPALPDLRTAALATLPDNTRGQIRPSHVRTLLVGLIDAVQSLGIDDVASLRSALFSGRYADLQGRPDLFSGRWADLLGRPTIPAAPADIGAQPYDADLAAIALLATTGFGRGFLTVADEAAARLKIGAVSPADLAAAIQSVVGMSPADLDTLQEIAARIVGDEATVAALAGTVAGKLAKSQNLADLLDRAAARENLGVKPGVDVQAYSATLAALAALATTTFGRNLLTATDAGVLTGLLTAFAGDAGTGGAKGLVPAPAAGDGAAGRFLRADGVWAQAVLGTPVPTLDDFRMLAIRLSRVEARPVLFLNSVADDLRIPDGVSLPDTYTTLLLHFDTAAGTKPVDSSPNPFPATSWVNNARVSTAQAAFGSGSLAFDGSLVGTLRSDGSAANFVLGTGDWTVNLRARLNSVSATAFLIDTRNTSSDSEGLYIYVNSAGKVVAGNNAASVTGTTTLSANTWADIEVSRASGTLRLFVNGALDGTLANFDYRSSAAGVCKLGSDADLNTAWVGFLDEVRFSKGIARHTAAFAPATAAFDLGESSNVTYDAANGLITNLVSGSPAAMELRSAPVAAQAVPTKGSLFVLIRATAGAIVAGSNLLADISRCGGSAWTAGTLVKAGTLPTGFDVYEVNGVDLTGQPSGTAVRWRLRTVGTALAVALDAAVLGWS